MKIKLFTATFILLTGCTNDHKEYSIDEFMKTTSFSGASFLTMKNQFLFEVIKPVFIMPMKLKLNPVKSSN